MSSRTSVFSWSTSTRPRPRRPAPRSLRTRWRLAVSRTRYVYPCTHPSSAAPYRRHPGCPRAPRCACAGEEAGDPRRGARCPCPGVNPTYPPSHRPPHAARSSLVSYPYAVSYAMRPTPIRQAHARMFYSSSMSSSQQRAGPENALDVGSRPMYSMYIGSFIFIE